MLYVAAYDVADPRRLYRVARVMKDYGQRVQYSVFEMDLASSAFESLRRRTEQELDTTADGVKYYPLCARCRALVYAFGPKSDGFSRRSFLVL